MAEEIESIIEKLATNTENWWRPLYYHVVPKIINDNGYKTGIEIGVAFGGHAEAMLKAGLDLLVCIDPWKFTGAEFEGLKTQEDFDTWYKFVQKRLGDKAVILREFSDVAHFMSYFRSTKKYDFVFIDGEHTYEQVFKDICNYLPKIKKGGMLIGHDYGHPDFEGVKRAVDEHAAFAGKEIVLHDGYVWSIQS